MPGRGFTLIELVIVLLVLGLIAGLTASSLRGGSGVDRVGESLVTRLLDARVMAMRSGVGAALIAETGDGVVRTRVEVEREGETEVLRRREERAGGVVIVDETPDFGWGGGPAAGSGEVRASYAASGRTTARRWVVRRGEGRGARMVLIEFDPVTGVPRLHRER